MDGLNEEDLRRNVQDKDTWVRFIYLAAFAIAYYFVLMPVTFVISLFQFLAKLFGGSSFVNLAEFGGHFAEYQAQVTRYLTFASDEKPFPFAPFPSQTPPTT